MPLNAQHKHIYPRKYSSKPIAAMTLKQSNISVLLPHHVGYGACSLFPGYPSSVDRHIQNQAHVTVSPVTQRSQRPSRKRTPSAVRRRGQFPLLHHPRPLWNTHVHAHLLPQVCGGRFNGRNVRRLHAPHNKLDVRLQLALVGRPLLVDLAHDQSIEPVIGLGVRPVIVGVVVRDGLVREPQPQRPRGRDAVQRQLHVDVSHPPRLLHLPLGVPLDLADVHDPTRLVIFVVLGGHGVSVVVRARNDDGFHVEILGHDGEEGRPAGDVVRVPLVPVPLGDRDAVQQRRDGLRVFG
mmetsp:Transcript_29858/g.88725  ORF Transcript_29858/g.88725 Transcript_29858/m.88725 type:complete len:294 (-) Transcript_29858:891-1772(-)